MGRATRATVAAFGAVAGLAGVEHGVGEVLQGNRAPDGLVIESWPATEAFRILQGEPAMTVIPNLLVTGIHAIALSLSFAVWAIACAHRKRGALVLILLAALMLLAGGGFGPPIIGSTLGIAATRIGSPLTWWRSHLPTGLRRLLARLCPWSLGAGVVAWLLLFPGTVIAAYLFRFGDADPLAAIVVSALTLSAIALLLLTIVAAFARDVEQQAGACRAPVPAASG